MENTDSLGKLGTSNEEIHETGEGNLEELKTAYEKLNSEIEEEQSLLEKIEEDKNETEKKIPVVDRNQEDRIYEQFCKNLGDHEKRMSFLKDLQKELSNIFMSKDYKNKFSGGVSIENQISLLSGLINATEKEFGGSYDEQQFLRRTKNVLPMLGFLQDKIVSYDNKYKEYKNERVANNEKVQEIEKRPEVIKLREDISALERSYKEKFGEMDKKRIERTDLSRKISKIENTAQKPTPSVESSEKKFLELEQVLSMPYNFSEEEYQDAARDDRKSTMEVSKDAFLRALRMIKESNSSYVVMTGFTSIHNILKRESMKDCLDIKLFEKAVEQLAEEKNYDLGVKKENPEA